MSRRMLRVWLAKLIGSAGASLVLGVAAQVPATESMALQLAMGESQVLRLAQPVSRVAVEIGRAHV